MVFIYALVDPRNNELRYIGKTTRPKKRLWEHIRKSRDVNSKKNIWIQELISLEMKPLIKILEQASDLDWKNREIYWIKTFKNSGSHLTNLTEGGDSPSFLNTTPVAKIDPPSGRILAVYNSIAEAARENKIPSESRIFDSCSGKCLYSYRFLWRFINKETGEITPVFNNKKRMVAQINYKTMEIIRKFSMVYDVRNYGFDVANVHSVCNGKLKSYAGFIWRYINDTGIINPKILYKNKMVNQLSLDGKFIERFENAKQAAEHLKVKCSDLILKTCRNPKFTAYKFRWEFNNF